nr:unnamed protein product [Spirometra erinaceieuropaei]
MSKPFLPSPPSCVARAARAAGRLNSPQGRGDLKGCQLQRNKELLRCDQRDLRPPLSPTKETPSLLSSDESMLLTEKSQILKRWAEDIKNVLSRPSTISEANIDQHPQAVINVDLNLPRSETISAVQQLSSEKAPGPGVIPTEIYRHGDDRLMDRLATLFEEIWRWEQVSQDFMDTSIVCLQKRKGSGQLRDTHRKILLLNIAGRIFVRILLGCLNGHLDQGLLPENQCCFRRHRDTANMVLAARKLQNKCQEMRIYLYTTFIVFTRAFNTVSCDRLWKIMQNFGCPKRSTHMVRQLRDMMIARATNNGAISKAFTVTNGVKQGCVLFPTLFSFTFSAIMMGTHRKEWPEIRIAYRTDGHLNCRRMQAHAQLSTATVHDVHFADDYALSTTAEENIQWNMDLLAAAGCTTLARLPTRWSYTNHHLARNTALSPESVSTATNSKSVGKFA